MAEEPVNSDATTAQVATDTLEDVETPTTPDTPSQEDSDAPKYRANVGPGGWTVPDSRWKKGEEVYLKAKNGKTAGPFTITFCHSPRNENEKWRYDIKDAHGNARTGLSSSHLF